MAEYYAKVREAEEGLRKMKGSFVDSLRDMEQGEDGEGMAISSYMWHGGDNPSVPLDGK